MRYVPIVHAEDPKPPLSGHLYFRCGDCGQKIGEINVSGKRTKRRHDYGQFYASLDHRCGRRR